MLGALAGDVFRYSVASMLIIVLGVILGFRPAGGVIGVLLAFGLVLVFAFALSWIWIIFGMKVKTPESVMTASFVFLMPLTFASNIFVGLETMPSWLQAIVRHNPVTHLTNASRGLMHGQPVGSDIIWVLVASAVIVPGLRADRAADVPPGAVRAQRDRDQAPWVAGACGVGGGARLVRSLLAIFDTRPLGVNRMEKTVALFARPTTTLVRPRIIARYPARATSSALDTRPWKSLTSLICARSAKCVLVDPGHNAVTVTPVPLSSSARASEKLKTYALLAQ